jgi:hypothetical protein
MPKRNESELRAEFWRAPHDALLTRATVAAGLCHSPRWLIEQEKTGAAPVRVRVGRFNLYRKREVMAYWLPGQRGTGDAACDGGEA